MVIREDSDGKLAWPEVHFLCLRGSGSQLRCFYSLLPCLFLHVASEALHILPPPPSFRIIHNRKPSAWQGRQSYSPQTNQLVPGLRGLPQPWSRPHRWGCVTLPWLSRSGCSPVLLCQLFCLLLLQPSQDSQSVLASAHSSLAFLLSLDSLFSVREGACIH